MTVQELIDKLMEVEEKQADIFYAYDRGDGVYCRKHFDDVLVLKDVNGSSSDEVWLGDELLNEYEED